MNGKGWILLAVVGVVVIGIVVVNSQSFGKLGSAPKSSGTLSDITSIFKSSASIFGDVEKAFPSWFSSGDTPSDDDLNKYPSSSGFATIPDFS